MVATTRKAGLVDAIGNTPLIEITRLERKPGARVFAKLEGQNPGGSIKDRPALFMIQKAEESGQLDRNKTIIEATSGNMGIALAMIGAARGYKVKLCMPECVSVERRLILEALGAEVVLTPAREAVDGAIRRVRKLVEEAPDKYFMPNQFDNPNNTLAHYATTGPEIFAQTDGKIDVFVAGMGTTGTLLGAGRYLKEQKPSLRVIGIEPPPAHTIQGLKNMTESIIPGIYDPAGMDDKITIGDGLAFETTRQLATLEGLFVGMSSGAAVAGALKVAQSMKQGIVVTIMPDRGDRYLSTTLFRSVCAQCPP